MTKRIVTLSLLVLVTLLFAACSAPTQPAAPAADTTAAEQPEATPTPIVAEFGDGDTQSGLLAPHDRRRWRHHAVDG